eukprot:GHVU01126324.1.p2 GENE.GHVU01126324.1~~GHVU01126324.1.p2  ORF type:complete len:109 (+),score=3.81 GHVU01126324.1:993-1319(+)
MGKGGASMGVTPNATASGHWFRLFPPALDHERCKQVYLCPAAHGLFFLTPCRIDTLIHFSMNSAPIRALLNTAEIAGMSTKIGVILSEILAFFFIGTTVDPREILELH